MRISLFITCYNDTLFPDTGKAVVAVLERLGHEVEFRASQTCCGQMHHNAGYWNDAVSLARGFLETFDDADAICAPSASCVAMIRESFPRIAAEVGDAAMRARVEAVVPRVYELSELLVDRLGVTDVGASYPHQVTLHPSCHSIRSLQVGDRPSRLLRAVRDLVLIDLPRADECCGFGGTFSITNADVSAAMLADKIDGLTRTGAAVCTATDNSCLMQIGGGLRKCGSPIRCVHLAEILAATASEEGSR